MKRLYSNIMPCLLLAGMAVTTACSNEEEPTLQADADNVLKIETCIADTRDVVMGTEFQKGDNIGVYVLTPDGHDYTGSSCNVRGNYNGSDWSLSPSVSLRSDEANVYAYYPYDETAATSGDSIDIDITPTTNGQPDYMVGSCLGLNQNNNTAKIAFRHTLARVTLSISKSAKDVGAGKISRVRLENNMLYKKDHSGMIPVEKDTYIAVNGAMSLKDGGINKSFSGDDCVELSTSCTINEKEPTNIDLLVMPCGTSGLTVSLYVGGGISLYITIDGADYKVNLNKPYWEAGQQYTYPITINRETDYSNIPGEKVYMGFNGDDGKPLYWSSYNLGSTSPEDYGGLYGWADPTGEKTSTDLNDYPSANPPSDISGTEYDIARQKWGGGWRIPSSNEIWSLVANSEAEWTTLNGVYGVKYTSEKNGNSIFIPTSPMRDGTSIIQPNSSTHTTYYWLDKLNADDNTKAGTYYIYKGTNLLDYPTAGKERYLGLPIRPVTEE